MWLLWDKDLEWDFSSSRGRHRRSENIHSREAVFASPNDCGPRRIAFQRRGWKAGTVHLARLFISAFDLNHLAFPLELDRSIQHKLTSK